MEKNNKPAFEIRLGELKATFWKSENAGVPRYGINLFHNFKEEDEWKNVEITDSTAKALLCVARMMK